MIVVTSEDVAAYDEARRRDLGLENMNPNNSGGSTVKPDPSDELKPLPGDKARIYRLGGGVLGASMEDRILGR